jgi:hypothetical protein
MLEWLNLTSHWPLVPTKFRLILNFARQNTHQTNLTANRIGPLPHRPTNIFRLKFLFLKQESYDTVQQIKQSSTLRFAKQRGMRTRSPRYLNVKVLRK